MIANLPRDVPPEMAEMYPELERQLSSMIRAKAARLRGVDIDDAVQEARIALLGAMHQYDFNRGDVLPYLRTVVGNTCRTLHTQSRTQGRCPRADVMGDSDEGWQRIPTPPVSLDGMSPEHYARCQPEAGETSSADFGQQLKEAQARVRKFQQTLLRRLDKRSAEILRAKIHPPRALIEQAKAARLAAGEEAPVVVDAPTNLEIARFMGLTKNKVDWALSKIRLAFADLATEEPFSDLFARVVEAPGWPVVHVSKGRAYHASFVHRTLSRRKLDDAPLRQERSECARGARTIIWQPWGCVLVVEARGEVWTAVVEGRLNPLTGEVHGDTDGKVQVSISGYAAMAKQMAADARMRRKECSMSDDGKTKAREFLKSLKVLPHCLSQYEAGDQYCDGDPAAEGDAGAPCFHRNTCTATKLRMESTNAELSEYVEERQDDEGAAYYVPKDLVQYAKMVQSQVKFYGLKDGRPTKVPRGSAPAAKTMAEEPATEAPAADKPKGKAKPAKTRLAATGNEALDAMFASWLAAIATGTHKDVSPEPNVGDLFIKDRRESSKYAGLYIKADKGRDHGIALVYYKTRTGCFDIKYALAPGDFKGIGKDVMKILHPEAHKDGVFISVSKNLDAAGVSHAAEVIARLINDGVLGTSAA